MKFEVYGPYEIPRPKGSKAVVLDNAEKRKFWDEVVGNNDLANACGCYVFAIGATGSYLPWYVGKTERSFKVKSLDPANILKFNQVMSARTRGTPYLFFLPKITDDGKFSKKSKNPEITALESILIAQAIERNPKIKNISGTKMLRGIEVVGFFNSDVRGPGKKSVQHLRKTFNVRRNKPRQP